MEKFDFREKTIRDEEIRACISMCDNSDAAITILINRILSLQDYIVDLQTQLAYFRTCEHLNVPF